MMADNVFTDTQNGAYTADSQGRPFPLEADLSRVVFGGSDGTLVQPTSDINYAPTTSEFAPKFNQLFMRSDDGRFYPVNQSNDGRFYPANTGQVQIPSYDMNPGLPCITQPCDGYDGLAVTNLQQTQLRPNDIMRIIMAANGGNYMEGGYTPSRWNQSQFSMFQPGRVPPSQAQAYNIARILLDPNSGFTDDRGMCPSDYPQLPCQRSNRCNPQQQWMNQRGNSNPHSYHQMINQAQQMQQMQRFAPNQGFNQNLALAIRLNPNLALQFNPGGQRFNPNYAQTFNPNYNPNFNPNYAQNFNPSCNPNFNPNYAQNFNPNYNTNFNPNYAQNFNPNYNPNYYPEYDPNYNPNYPQDYNPGGCDPRFNPRYNQQWNQGCNGGGNMSQLMRYAPFVLSMLGRGSRGFPGGFQGGFPGGFGGGFNQFNRFGGGGYNNFNNFNGFGGGGYGGRGVGVRIGNFSFRL